VQDDAWYLAHEAQPATVVKEALLAERLYECLVQGHVAHIRRRSKRPLGRGGVSVRVKVVRQRDAIVARHLLDLRQEVEDALGSK
jgi:hypothetical protein